MLENPTVSQGEKMNPALLSKGQRGDLCQCTYVNPKRKGPQGLPLPARSAG